MASPDTIINNATTYANNLIAQSQTALTNATAAISAIEAPEIIYEEPNVGSLTTTFIGGSPNLNTFNFTEPTKPIAPSNIQDIPDLDLGIAPTFNQTAPTLELPDKPSELPEFTAVMPSIELNMQFPTEPQILQDFNVIEPVINERAPIEKPTIILPEFNSEKPIDNINNIVDIDKKFIDSYKEISPQFVSVLENNFDLFLNKINPQYKSQLEKIENKLSKYLDGGSALTSDIENQIFERNKDKINKEYIKARETIYSDISKRGFTLPNGSLQSSLNKIRTESFNNNARSSVEIAIKQAELEQQNMQFAITTSNNIRQQAISSSLSYFSSLININGQAIEYAKTISNFLIETLNSQIKIFQTKLEGYKTDAAIFETKLKAVLSQIDIYKAEIEAEISLQKQDLTKIEVYKAKIDILNSAANVYRTKIDAVVSKANLEKIKVDLFQGQVQVYQSQVQAKNAEWQGYSAIINGEESKFKIFDSQIRAYQSQLEGYKTTISAKETELRAKTSKIQFTQDKYKNELQAYTSLISANREIINTKLENERLKLNAFQAETQVYLSNAELQKTSYMARANIELEKAKAKTASDLANAQFLVNKLNKVADSSTQLAGVYNSAASAAISGLVSVASITSSV